MEQLAKIREPRTKFKTFTYETYLNWTGNRTGKLHSKSKPDFRVSSPPEFKGEKGLWSPEDLFVASVDICTMTTFMAFAQHKNLKVISYHTHAEGMLEYVDGRYQFTRIILRPIIKVESQEAIEQAREILADAHKGCFVSNSINCEVIIEPKIRCE